MPVYKSPWYAFWCQLSFLFLMEWYSTLGWRQLEAFYISWWNWKRERSLVFGTMTAGNVFQSCCCVFVVAVVFVVVVFVVFVQRRKMKERASGWLVFRTMTARKVSQSYTATSSPGMIWHLRNATPVSNSICWGLWDFFCLTHFNKQFNMCDKTTFVWNQ